MKKMFSNYKISESIDIEATKSMLFGLSNADAHAWLSKQLDLSLKDWHKISDFIETHCIDSEIAFT